MSHPPSNEPILIPQPFPSLLDDDDDEEAAMAAAVDDEELMVRALAAAETTHTAQHQQPQQQQQQPQEQPPQPSVPDVVAPPAMYAPLNAHPPVASPVESQPPPAPLARPPLLQSRPRHTLPSSLPPVPVTPSIAASFARAATAAANAREATARETSAAGQQPPTSAVAAHTRNDAVAVPSLPPQPPQSQAAHYHHQLPPAPHPSVLQSPMPATPSSSAMGQQQQQPQMQIWPDPQLATSMVQQQPHWQQPPQYLHAPAPGPMHGPSHVGYPSPAPAGAFPPAASDSCPPVGFPPPSPAAPALAVPAAAAPAAFGSQPNQPPAPTPPSYTVDGRVKRTLVAVDSSSLLELFALYFPDDWPGGSDVLAPCEASNRRAVRESNGKFRIVERLSRFFHTHREQYILEPDVLAYSRVVLDYPSFCAHIDGEIRGFEKEMSANPALMLAALQCALHHTCTTPTVHTDGSPLASARPFRPLHFALPRLLVRFRAFRPCVSIKAAMKAARLGQFVCVQGTVVRTTPAHPAVQCMQFECTRCGRRKMAEFRDGIYAPPSGCDPPCHNKTLEPDRLTAHCIDRQVIKLQEIIATANVASPSVGTAGAAGAAVASSSGASSPDAARMSADASVAALTALEEQGRVPRTLEVHLQGADLVDCCIPGDVVSVCGFVRSRKQEQGLRGRNASVFVLFVEANALTKAQGEESAGSAAAMGSSSASLMLKQPSRQLSSSTSAFDPLAEFSPAELGAIRDFVSSNPNPFKTLVASLCPSIFGHEVVKAGLLLSLLGGVTKSGPADRGGQRGNGGPAAGGKSESAGGRMSVRGDIHVLCVGDPGLGKSQMLRAASRASPRGVYVSGGATSKTGLTVTMVRDGKDGDFALEAGALVLADQGVCCIDEFDKMGAEHSALLEAMEQQSISIAKAGMVCSLAARSAVIAAANPVGGHYDRAKTLSENLRIGTPLLSRFDLVFVLLDRPDLDRDQRLSEHVVAAHGAKRKRARPMDEDDKDALFPATPPRSSQASAFDSPSSMAAGRPLARRLRVQPNDHECEWNGRELNLLPAVALRKYIAYARKYCRPLLSAGARSLLGDFFLSLRALAAMAPADSTPVTARQLEALVRLCEARARADLQEVATVAHAQDVIDLLRESRADLAAADGSGGDEALSADMALAAATMGASSRGGRSGSKVALKKQFVSLLRRKAEVRTEPVFSASELYQLHEAAGLKRVVPDFDAFIDALNTDGFLLRCGAKKYKLVPSLT